MPLKQMVYLLLATTGLVMTWYHNLAFMQEAGGVFSFAAYIDGVYANHASSSIGWDITIACIAFLVWMVGEARALGMQHVWVYLLLTFAVAFAFSAPLFLFMRERHLAAQRRAG